MEIKKYEQSLIAFDFESDMVNATDMARKFNKRTIDFLRLDSTKAFIDALESDVYFSHNTSFRAVSVIKGNYSDGRVQGTWMHRLLAFKFASWLDPRFELFVYSVFDSFLKSKLEWQQKQLDSNEDEIYDFLEKNGLA